MILCHIVGMNNMIKNDFNEFLNKYPIIHICDLDTITNKIRSDAKMKKLNKSKKKKEINKYWKTTLSNEVNKVLNNYKNKKIIFIGLCTFHKNNRLKVKISTQNKFFLKINPKHNAMNIVHYNIEKYKKYIIKGIFPLNYIDHKFLINQRNIWIKVYTNMKYKFKTYNAISKWIKLKLGNTQKLNRSFGIKNVHDLYIGSTENYNNILENKSSGKSMDEVYKLLWNGKKPNFFTGYNLKWLALLSGINNCNNLIKKGFLEDNKRNKIIPFIEERIIGAFDELNNSSCYLYTIDKKQYNKVGQYKYKIYGPINIKRKKKINNIYNELIINGVRLVRFKKIY